MSTIYLIRHGQAPFGSEDYDRLTPLGFEQAGVLGGALRERLPQIDVVVHGGMQRHRLTAETCLQAWDAKPSPGTDEGFREYDHLDVVDRYMDRKALAGVAADAASRRREFERQFVQVMQRWQAGDHDEAYTESWPVFRDRCTAALERLGARLGRGQTALVFTSGGVISALALALLELPLSGYADLNWRLVNAGVSKLLLGGGGLRLSTLNEHAHFEGARSALLTYR